ncbi:MAG: polyphenol oxidase family protein [Deltaproteobacteria bacterium]|nr:polyphenol oxidase family protein [Deltaproteobacteria bacterium]
MPQLNKAFDLHHGDTGTPILHYRLLSGYPDLIHGVFTRKGGVSAPPFDQLNTSYSVGDQPDRVASNLRIIQAALDAPCLATMNQCHGIDVHLLKGHHLRKPLISPAADATITDLPDAAVLVKQADCQAVILFDPENHVTANVHCGWRGNVNNILGKVVLTMRRAYGSSPDHIVAAIGPSLGPCCAEFVDHKTLFPETFDAFRVGEDHFDLWALSRHQLLMAGLRTENIVCAKICTRCRTDLFFSYRGEGTTGRFGTVVMIRKTREKDMAEPLKARQEMLFIA